MARAGAMSIGAVISYNSFTFPGAVHADITISPVYSKDGRTVKYRRYIIGLSGVLVSEDFGLSSGASIESAMMTLRNQLTTPGKTFTFTGMGLGSDLTITNLNTIGFGPKPGDLHLKSIGGICFVYSWSIEFQIVDCESVARGVFGEFTYGLSLHVGRDGCVTRRLSGEYEALVVKTGARIIGTADDLWDRLSFPPLPGFHREHSHELSPDKTRCTWTILDEEIPSNNPYYPQTVNLQVSHAVHNQAKITSGGLQIWENIISGTAEVAQGVSHIVAFQAILVVVSDRLQQARFGSATGRGAGFQVVTGLEIVEDIYNRSVSFKIGWRLSTELRSLIGAIGIFQPVPGSWEQWAASMDRIINPRGVSQLRHVAGDDIIVNFCGGAPSPTTTYGYKPVMQGGYIPISGVTPPRESSYLGFSSRFNVERESNTTFIAPIVPQNQVPQGNPGAGRSNAMTSSSSSSGGQSANYKVQQRGVNQVMLRFSGEIVRAGYPIDLPYIEQIAGKPAVMASESLMPSTLVATVLDVPIYIASWDRLYYAPDEGDLTMSNNYPNQFLT